MMRPARQTHANEVRELMKYPLSLLAALSLAAAPGCSSPVSLTVLLANPSAPAPDSIELRVYDDFGLIGMKTIFKPTLPGAISLTQLPSQSDQLRVIAAGLDAAPSIRTLAGATM